MKKSILFSLITTLALSACVQKAIKKNPNARLFPNGIYTQNIQLKLFPKTKKQQNIPFRTVSKINGKMFEMIALTPLGTTAFQASGHLDHPEKIQLKFFMDRPSSIKDNFIQKTIANIQSFHNLKRKDLSTEIDRDTYTKDDVKLEIYSYNSSAIPQQIRVRSKDWIASIYTESYKIIEN